MPFVLFFVVHIPQLRNRSQDAQIAFSFSAWHSKFLFSNSKIRKFLFANSILKWVWFNSSKCLGHFILLKIKKPNLKFLYPIELLEWQQIVYISSLSVNRFADDSKFFLVFHSPRGVASTVQGVPKYEHS